MFRIGILDGKRDLFFIQNINSLFGWGHKRNFDFLAILDPMDFDFFPPFLKKVVMWHFSSTIQIRDTSSGGSKCNPTPSPPTHTRTKLNFLYVFANFMQFLHIAPLRKTSKVRHWMQDSFEIFPRQTKQGMSESILHGLLWNSHPMMEDSIHFPVPNMP